MMNKVLYATVLMWSVSAKIFVMDSQDLPAFMKALPKSSGDMSLEHSAVPEPTETKKRSLNQISDLIPVSCDKRRGGKMFGYARRPDLQDAKMMDNKGLSSCLNPVKINASESWSIPPIPEFFVFKEMITN